MNTLPAALSWLDAPAWLPLIHALLHTLWQGALAAGGLFLVLRMVPARRADLRYGLSAAALALVVLAGVGSWALLDTPRDTTRGAARGPDTPAMGNYRLPGAASSATVFVPVPSGKVAARSANISSAVDRAGMARTERWAPWIAAGWLLGVAVSLLRAVKGTLAAGRLRSRCRDLVDPRVLEMAEHLRMRLGVWRRVRLLVCDEIGVPSMLGVFYPALLLPASLLTGVPHEQLRAILAHELAHVRRWDYPANLVQMLVEAWLFFNPFVWWISRQVRLEREACCDQVAAEECQSPACYVEALMAVIERGRLTGGTTPPVLAASGPGAHNGSTLERARRLLVPGYQPAFRVRWFSLTAVLILSVLTLGGWWLGARAVAQTIQVAGAKTAPKTGDGSNPLATVPGLPADVLAAARVGNAKKASSLMVDSLKPKKFGEEDAASTLDNLVRARELRAFTTLYERWQRSYAKDWQLGDELLAALVKEGRTDFLDALIARRFDLTRLTKAAGSAEPATAGWITRRVAEVTREQTGTEALEKAAEQGDLAAIGRLLDAGADVNGVGQDDNTPLLRAVFKDRLEAAQFLLDHGAQVDKPRLPGWNYTPLCLVNSVPMAELLKKNGADVHAKLYERDVSILDYAAEWAKADVVAWFLKQGLDANMATDNHRNLLFGLTDGGTAEALLEAGANPNLIDEFGHTPLTSAQSAEVVRALVRHGADLKPKLKDGATLLEYAVMNVGPAQRDPQRDAAYIEELIKQGAEFDPRENGAKAMIKAAFSDRVGEVQAFLDHGVSPNAQNNTGPFEHTSALSSAAWQAPEALKLLLQRGADPNAPLPAGQWSPLSSALTGRAFGNADLLRQAGAEGLPDLAYYSAKGDVSKVSELLGQHADPNECDTSGWTALHYAIRHAEVEVARRLLDHGASGDLFDARGISPYLDFADFQQMIEYDARQAQMQWRLSPAEAKIRLAAFQQLFTQHPPDPAYRDASGRTALHQAAWSGNSMSFGVMLAGKPPRFDPNLPDKEGKIPLLLATLSPVAKETQEIITAGVDTPQQKTWNQQAYITKEFLKAGARLDLAAPGGKTVGESALAAARDANNAQLVAVLAEAMAPAAPPAAPTPTPPGKSNDPVPAATPASQPRGLTGLPTSRPVAALVTTAQGVIDGILAAARAGDSGKVGVLLAASISQSPQLGKESAVRMLEDLVRQRELTAFTTLRDELKKTNLDKDWQISDELLSGLVKEDRRDFLDALLARDLAPDRLSQQASAASSPAAGWIARRVAEVTRQRADIEALGRASSEGDLPTMRRLIEAGVDVNAVDKNDNTMLIETVHQNRLEAARLLLDHGADANKPRFPGWDYSPLCLVHSVEMAEVLQRAGGDVHGKLFGRNVSILTYVARWSTPEVVAWFLQQGLDPKMIVDNDQTLLFKSQDARTVELLLDKGVDPNRLDEFGQTPLCTARNAEVAQKLIDHGAKLTGFKKSLLPQMVQLGSAGAVETVLKAQARPDHQEVQRALVNACFMDREEIARVLLKHGANPNEPTLWRDDDERTTWPLLACTINPSAKTAQVLLDAGADPNGGGSPGAILNNAIANGHKDVAEILRKAGARGVSELRYSISVGDEGKIRELLASAPTYGDDPAFWDGVLVEAVRRGNLPVVLAAADKGLPVGKDPNAIREAASAGQPEVLAALLERRTRDDDPEPLLNSLWEAAFKSSAYRQSPDASAYERCVELLLKTGAPFRTSGLDNFMVAAVFTESPGGNLKVVEMLAKAGFDPNPPMKSESRPQGHLLDAIQEAVAQGDRAPTAAVILAINRLVAASALKNGSDTAAAAEHPVFLSSVHVTAEDQTPIDPRTVMVYDHVPTPEGILSGSARAEASGAPLWIFLDAMEVGYAAVKDGYAPTFAGPFRPPLEEQLKNVPVVLARGATASLQVVDEAGQPIAGAKLEGYYPGPPLIDHKKANGLETRTDAGGAAAFEHVGASFNVQVTAVGYQDGEIAGFHADSAGPYRLTLHKAQPVAGVVTSAATGQPVAGARLKLAAVRGPEAEETHEDPAAAPLVATTDEQGRFGLPNLRADSTYFLFVEAAGYGSMVLEAVRVGQPEVKVALGRELYVRGKFIHAAKQKVPVSYMQMIPIGQGSWGVEKPSEIEANAGEGSFAIGPLYPASLTLRIGGQRIKLQADDLPKSDLVVDLAGD